MSAGAIPDSTPPLVLASSSAGNIPPLTEGEIINAQVVEDLGEGRYGVQLGAREGKVVVESQVPLSMDQPIPLRVAGTGARVVLELAGTLAQTAGNAGASTEGASQVAAAVADQVSMPSPFSVSVDLGQAAAHVSETSTPGNVPVGLVVNGTEIAIHFPDGAVVPGQAAPPVASPALQAAIAADAGMPLTDTAAWLDAIGPVLDSLQEAALLADQVYVRVQLPEAGAASGMLTLPVTDLPRLTAQLNALADGAPLMATVAAVDPETLLLQVGDLNLRLVAGEALDVQAGETLPLQVEPEALLSGSLRASVDMAGTGVSLVDARLLEAGLTPSPLSREAAQALLDAGLPVDRQGVQHLLALAAGREGEARIALLTAGARLLARDMPLSPPLAAGLASLESGAGRVADAIARMQSQIQSVGASLPEGSAVADALAQASSALDRVAVLLGQADTPVQLSEFLSAYGREPLAAAAGQLEAAAQMHLGSQPPLQRLDAAIQALLTALQSSQTSGEGGRTALAAGDEGVPSAATPVASDPQVSAAPTAGAGLAVSPGPGVPGLGDAIMAALRAAHPGVNAPDGGPAGAGAAPDIPASEGARIAELVRQVLDAPDAARAEQLVRQVVAESDPQVQRSLLEALAAHEREVLARDPVVHRLAEVTEALRDVGRHYIATKAENVAGMRQDPGVFVADVPFQFGEDQGDGRLQVFYRRGRQRQSGQRWSARVVLDLQTTRLGPVVGDMRFFKQDLTISLFAADQDLADFLARDQGELRVGLRDKGFRCSPRFLVIPAAKVSPPATGTEDPDSPSADPGRLDVKA